MNLDLTRLVGRAWPMEARRLEALAASFGSMPEGREPRSAEDRAKRSASPLRNGYEVRDGVALLAISGPIIGDVFYQELFEWFGVPYTDPNDVSAQLARAMGDPKVSGVLLVVDSPGGIITGVQAAAQAIHEAAALGDKPVNAHVLELAASAAYWLASQASRISAEPTAEIGSIGVYTVITDSAARYQGAGLKVHLIASGPDKGVGVAGVAISDQQLTPFREDISDLCALFKADVARGRAAAPAKVDEWATGRTWVAARAMALGLVDAVESLGAALSECGPDKRKRNSAAGVVPAASSAVSDTALATKEGAMPENVTVVNAAPPTDPVAEFASKNPEAVKAFRAEGVKASEERFAALAGEFKGEPQFVIEQFAQGADVEKARVAFKDVKLARLTEENARLKAASPVVKAEAINPSAPAADAVDPVTHVEGGAERSPEEQLKADYDAEVAAGKFSASFGAYKALRAREDARK